MFSGDHSPARFSLLIAACLIAAPNATAQPPDTVELLGILRDFHKDHADFGVDPVDGLGHYAGNIDVILHGSGRPDFMGNGFLVASQWRNSGSQPIAPHLAVSVGGLGVVQLVQAPDIDDNPTIDTFDSALGPYGGSNVGPAPTFEVGAEMPVVTEPTGLPPLIDEWKRDGIGTTVLSTDIHCNKFEVANDHEIQVSGNVTVLAEELFTIHNHAEIVLLPGATMNVYIKKDGSITNHVNVNVNTHDPSRFVIYNLGSLEFKLSNNVDVYAHVIAPTGSILIENDADLYGGYTGNYFHVKNTGGLHIDDNRGGSATACGVPLNDTEGTAGVTSDGAITSADTFDEWYRDVLGTNVSRHHTITLVRDTTGVYEYVDDSFYPLDGQGFGNEGDAHNNHFTYAIDAEFTYDSCSGQFIELTSVDDGWVFVDGYLAIDLGGIVPGTEQIIELDRLGLIDGEMYDMHLYFAHRHGSTPQLRLRTNIEFEDDQEVVATISFMYD